MVNHSPTEGTGQWTTIEVHGLVLDVPPGAVEVHTSDRSEPGHGARRSWLLDSGAYLTCTTEPRVDEDPLLAESFGILVSRYEADRGAQVLRWTAPSIPGATASRSADLALDSAAGEPLIVLVLMVDVPAGSRTTVQIARAATAGAATLNQVATLASSIRCTP